MLVASEGRGGEIDAPGEKGILRRMLLWSKKRRDSGDSCDLRRGKRGEQSDHDPEGGTA